ncbi:MAG: tryptophan 2,3-dioxygenase family protein [Flavobacteriales bacterium]|nr:tryptophan 2,3-dioxygenase family protein [Flavobacteriales bacterium]
MEITDEIKNKLQLLHAKYEAMGQDMNSYLDGLLYADVTTYWDYIQTDTLLSIQKPKTPFPDEEIFIMYHQITELYFKLSLHELRQICFGENRSTEFLTARITRINRYFEALTKSFEIMINGMEQEQFLKFRMSLLPASGFQSAQYRMIEIHCTDLINLTERSVRQELAAKNASIEELFSHIYWKRGATELASGKKTLTLRQFEEKYTDTLVDLAHKVSDCNLWKVIQSLPEEARNHEPLRKALRQLDLDVNVNWPMVHMKSAARYLEKKPEDIAATGGTNWQKYLPPRFQRRIFFPELWSAEELEEWGKG